MGGHRFVRKFHLRVEVGGFSCGTTAGVVRLYRYLLHTLCPVANRAHSRDVVRNRRICLFDISFQDKIEEVVINRAVACMYLVANGCDFECIADSPSLGIP